MRYLAGLGIVGILNLTALLPANALEPPTHCLGLSVRSMDVSSKVEPEHIANPRPEISQESASAGNTVTLVAIGPVLGGMDSPDVKTDLACTTDGVAVTATITRSANYTGSILRNVIWRPSISMTI